MSLSRPLPAEEGSALNGPALDPPEGIISNFENPPNSSTLSMTVVTMCLSISTLAGLIRTYAKLFKTRAAKVEDSKYMMIRTRCCISYPANHRLISPGNLWICKSNHWIIIL